MQQSTTRSGGVPSRQSTRLTFAAGRACSQRLSGPIAAAVLLALLSGCGGGADDPFERADVNGTVAIDGQPLKYGQIYFRSGTPDKSAEVAQALLEVRDGKFSSNRAFKPGRGKNTVTVTAYVGDPPPPPGPNDDDAEAPEPKVLGYWRTEVELADKKPLELTIPKSELKTKAFD